jgi:L-amino acid N-acyltransferase YncA
MFCIRVATMGDAEAIRDIYAPYVHSTPISFDTEVPTVAEMRAAIVERLEQYPWLIAEVDGDIVGYAYASTHHSRPAYRWSVDVSIYIAKSHQRQGLAKLFYSTLLPILQQQGFRMIHAGITLPNEASVKLHEAFGFRRVAFYQNVGHKCGEWRNVGWWSLDLMSDNDTNDIPVEPLPFPEVGFTTRL